jgi:3-isopropylmalate/(R)-2-methylmalate dehydratase small subunit
MPIVKKCIKYGDNISTDMLVAGRYTKTTDIQEMVSHCMEDLDPHYLEKIKGGAFIVAGENFGCGSSKEQAAIVAKASGAVGIVARSFARIFFRNAVNLGLPVIECDTSGISEGDILSYEPGEGKIVNTSTGQAIAFKSLPENMQKILDAGGVVNYINEHGTFPK